MNQTRAANAISSGALPSNCADSTIPSGAPLTSLAHRELTHHAEYLARFTTHAPAPRNTPRPLPHTNHAPCGTPARTALPRAGHPFAHRIFGEPEIHHLQTPRRGEAGGARTDSRRNSPLSHNINLCYTILVTEMSNILWVPLSGSFYLNTWL